MSNDAFDTRILNEKLSELNNSQQSIESLSRWCVLHRKKARHIVEIWEKLFNSSQREKRVSFLYLANDILQNSRRKGSEFVNEFWKVLPGALKQVYENGEEHGKKVVTRLVHIWEERKVFGSRGQGLKDEMLGKNPPPLLVSNGKSSNPNPIKIMKRDAHSVRFKLAVGGIPEKILTAFQSVIDEHLDEEAALNNFTDAVTQVGKIRQEIENGPPQGNQQISTFMDELQVQENVLQQCVGKLESAEATRAILISQLEEALQDQESKLDLIRGSLQVARGHIEQVIDVRNKWTSPIVPGTLTTSTVPMTDASKVVEHKTPPVQRTSTPPQPSLSQPMVSFAPMKTTDEDKKAAVAAVAAKLAASTSSAQMLTSVLSSLVAEEAAFMNGGLKSSGFTTGLTMFSPEKRPKFEKPMSVSHDSNVDVGNAAYFTSLQKKSGTTVPPSSSMQSSSQSNQLQTSFGALPPLPPPPSLSPANPTVNQFVQSTGMMVMPYGYGSNPLPPPPPLPQHIALGLARPAGQPPQQSQSQLPQQQQQQTPASGAYYRPPGVGFYGQNRQSATPPVPRQ